MNQRQPADRLVRYFSFEGGALMPTKRLQILANSVKKQQHCIAGRELLEHGGGMSFGNWIRPVTEKVS
jgi:hypothetical protein